ncbi:hypothetical protein SCA03_35230 [Streptomyces cacaoi]|uniref:Uncharacterized protein n=1 Tax=Streptomyces cacaoi TaxID=1898 RepID=A0A4Y3R0G9_STRCI|nr:hypothetical protein SCA03_35230 [Streptomyces cacaoi]
MAAGVESIRIKQAARLEAAQQATAEIDDIAAKVRGSGRDRRERGPGEGGGGDRRD